MIRLITILMFLVMAMGASAQPLISRIQLIPLSNYVLAVDTRLVTASNYLWSLSGSTDLTVTNAIKAGSVQVVDTIAAMIALSPATNSIHVRSYAGTNGLGGGRFDLRGTNGYATNLGTVFASTAPRKFWFRVIDGPYNPLWFGASESVANNQPAFQGMFNDALKSLATGSNIVVSIPAGTFNFTAPILLTNCRSTVIYGAGMNNTILRANYAGSVLRTDGFWYSSIENMQFLGAVAHTGAVIEIDGNRAHDYVNFGVQGNRFSGLFISGGDVVANGFWLCPVGGSYGQGSENTFFQCAFNYCTNSSMRITGQNALNNSFDTCNFQGNLQWAVLTEGGNINMRNCAFQNATAGYGTQRGYDVGITGPASYACSTFYGIDSESARFLYGGFQAYVEKLSMRATPGTWAASTAYAVSNMVIPTVPNGFAYRCITAGTTSNTEPSWVGVDGTTVQDGPVVWRIFDDTVVYANEVTHSYIPFGRASGNIGARPADISKNTFTRTNFWRSDNFTADTSLFGNVRYAGNLVVPSQGANAVPYSFVPGGVYAIKLDSQDHAIAFSMPSGAEANISITSTGLFVGGGGSNLVISPGSPGRVILPNNTSIGFSDAKIARVAGNYLSIDSVAGTPSTVQLGTLIAYNLGFVSMAQDTYAISLHSSLGRILFGTGIGTFDVGFYRSAAGVIEVNDGTLGGGTLRDFRVRYLGVNTNSNPYHFTLNGTNAVWGRYLLNGTNLEAQISAQIAAEAGSGGNTNAMTNASPTTANNQLMKTDSRVGLTNSGIFVDANTNLTGVRGITAYGTLALNGATSGAQLFTVPAVAPPFTNKFSPHTASAGQALVWNADCLCWTNGTMIGSGTGYHGGENVITNVVVGSSESSENTSITLSNQNGSANNFIYHKHGNEFSWMQGGSSNAWELNGEVGTASPTFIHAERVNRSLTFGEPGIGASINTITQRANVFFGSNIVVAGSVTSGGSGFTGPAITLTNTAENFVMVGRGSNGVSAFAWTLNADGFGTNYFRIDWGSGAVGQSFMVHSKTVFGTTNFYVMTNGFAPSFTYSNGFIVSGQFWTNTTGQRVRLKVNGTLTASVVSGAPSMCMTNVSSGESYNATNSFAVSVAATASFRETFSLSPGDYFITTNKSSGASSATVDGSWLEKE